MRVQPENYLELSFFVVFLFLKNLIELFSLGGRERHVKIHFFILLLVEVFPLQPLKHIDFLRFLFILLVRGVLVPILRVFLFLLSCLLFLLLHPELELVLLSQGLVFDVASFFSQLGFNGLADFVLKCLFLIDFLVYLLPQLKLVLDDQVDDIGFVNLLSEKIQSLRKVLD